MNALSTDVLFVAVLFS